jgi:hypothetical protein
VEIANLKRILDAEHQKLCQELQYPEGEARRDHGRSQGIRIFPMSLLLDQYGL